jgi:hypothetical protein
MDLTKLKELQEGVVRAQQVYEAKRDEVARQIGHHALELGAAEIPPDVLTGALLMAVEANKAGGVQAAELSKRGSDFRTKQTRRPGRPAKTSDPAGGAAPIPSSNASSATETASHDGSE